MLQKSRSRQGNIVETLNLKEISGSIAELGIKADLIMSIGRPAEEIIKTIENISPSLTVIGAQEKETPQCADWNYGIAGSPVVTLFGYDNS